MGPLNQEFVRLLELAGWTQAEAARRLYLDPGTVSFYVHDKVRPSLTVLALFKSLIGDAQPLPGSDAPVSAANRHLEPWENEIVDGLRSLDAERRKRVARCILALLDELPKGTHIVGVPSSGTPALLVVHSAVAKSVREKPLPEPLKKVPSSLGGFQESARREQSRKTKGKSHSKNE